MSADRREECSAPRGVAGPAGAALLASLAGPIPLHFLGLFGYLLVAFGVRPMVGDAVLFLNLMFSFAVPALLFGAIMGRVYPRWGWMPAVSGVVLLALNVGMFSSLKHASFVPAAALVGWGIGAWSRSHRLRWTATAAPALAAVLALFLLTGLVGRSDRDWFLAEVSGQARILGYAAGQPPQLQIMDMNFFPSQTPPGVKAVWHEREQETHNGYTMVLLYPPDFRRRLGERARAERFIANFGTELPDDVQGIRELVTGFGVPEQFLVGLRPADAGENGPETFPSLSRPAYIAGPEVGTWEHPRVEVGESVITLRVGLGLD